MIASNADGPLASSSLRQFIYALGSRSSAPGGGSASAAIAAMVTEPLKRLVFKKFCLFVYLFIIYLFICYYLLIYLFIYF